MLPPSKARFLLQKNLFLYFLFHGSVTKVFVKIKTNQSFWGNMVFNGIFPITCCGLAWGTVTRQFMSFTLRAVRCSSATTSQPTCWDLQCPRPTQLPAPLTCWQKHFGWEFLGTFLWHYAIAWWKVKKFKDWFVLFLIKQCLEVLKPGGKFRILLEEPDGFQMSFLLTQTSSWPCFSG